jgi:hypothetical protein
MRDFQKSKVYAWEKAVVAPRTDLVIPFNRAQQFVDGVWLSLGFQGPPRVSLMAPQAIYAIANGCRHELKIRRETPAWVILHELAHAINQRHDKAPEASVSCDAHGPNFVDIYIKLLDKVLNIPLALTMYSLRVHGVRHKEQVNGQRGRK